MFLVNSLVLPAIAPNLGYVVGRSVVCDFEDFLGPVGIETLPRLRVLVAPTTLIAVVVGAAILGFLAFNFPTKGNRSL